MVISFPQTPSHKPTERRGFLGSRVSATRASLPKERALCFGSATCSSTLRSWKFPTVLFSKLCHVVRTRCVCADNRKGCEGWIPRALLCKHITGAISIKGESLPDGQAQGLFLITCNFIKAYKNAGCPFSPSLSLNSSKVTVFFFFLLVFLQC